MASEHRDYNRLPPVPHRPLLYREYLGLGRPVRRLANRTGHLYKKMARARSNRDFLYQCLDNGLVPRGLRLPAVGVGGESGRMRAWRAKAERERVVAVARDAKAAFFRTRDELHLTLDKLREAAGDLAVLAETDGRKGYSDLLASKGRAKGRKFTNLLLERPLVFSRRRTRCAPLPAGAATEVVQLSGRELGEAELELLTLGGKYAFPPKSLPLRDVVVRCEEAGSRALKETGRTGATEAKVAEFKNGAVRALTVASRAPLPTLPPHLQRAARVLQADRETAIVPADKARALIVLLKSDYDAALYRCLVPDLYEECPRDPSPPYNTWFRKALLDSFVAGCPGPPPPPGTRRDSWLWRLFPARARAYRELHKTHGRPGAFYGLAKNHKWEKTPETPEEKAECIRTLKLRPISPGFRAIDAQMARHLNSCLQLLPRPPHSVRSPLEILDALEEHGALAYDYELLGLDVTAMYPNVDADQAVNIAERGWQEAQGLLREVSFLTAEQLANFLRRSNSNTFIAIPEGDETRYFRQRRGLAMGKAYAPALADVFMGEWEADLEERAERAGGRLGGFWRYMDDVLCLWCGSDDARERWLDDINSKHPTIKVTMEREKEGTIAFLDILVRRTPTGFTTSVFRKACATTQTIPYSSFSDSRYLRGAVTADVLRALRYCKQEPALGNELSFVFAKYRKNGYPVPFLNRAFTSTIERYRSRAGPGAVGNERPDYIRMAIPYIDPATHALRRLGRGIGVEFVTKPIETLASRYCSRHKHKLPKGQQSEVVYGINCSCGAYYVGETGRELSDRVGEHERSWTESRARPARSEEEERRHPPKSAFGSRAHRECEPGFGLEDVDVLGREKHESLRRLLESTHILTIGRGTNVLLSTNDPAINRQAGQDIDRVWLPLLFADV